MSKKLTKSEQFIESWMALSGVLRNERLVKGFTFREISICEYLYKAEKGSVVTPSDITAYTGMLKSQTHKVLSDLEKKGYISHEKNPKDRRQVMLTLTPEGKKNYLKEHKEVVRLLDKVTEGMTDAKVRSICRSIDEITAAIKNFDLQLGIKND